VLQCSTNEVKLPDLAFSEYFYDHNHQHNITAEDVLDAVVDYLRRSGRIFVGAFCLPIG